MIISNFSLLIDRFDHLLKNNRAKGVPKIKIFFNRLNLQQIFKYYAK